MTPGDIGKNDLRRKRRELGGAVKSKKLPTLAPFGKTSSCRTPQRNDDAVVLIKEWVSSFLPSTTSTTSPTARTSALHGTCRIPNLKV